MEKKRTNFSYVLAEYSQLNAEERELVEKLSYLNPEIADYGGHENPINSEQVLRAFFKLNGKIESAKTLEEKLVSEGILSEENPIKVQETIQTEHGKMYLLSSKGSKFALYFINPEQ